VTRASIVDVQMTIALAIVLVVAVIALSSTRRPDADPGLDDPGGVGGDVAAMKALGYTLDNLMR